MAIRYSRDSLTGDYLAHDTDTGTIERYTTQEEWLYHSLVRILAMTVRMEQGLARLQRMLSRGASVDEAPSVEIPVWP